MAGFSLTSLLWLLLLQLAASQSLKSPAEYFASLSLNKCPIRCDDPGSSTQNWTLYHTVDQLMTCDKPTLLNFAFSSSDNATASSGGITAVDAHQDTNKPFVALGCSTNKGHLVFDEQPRAFDALIQKGIKNSTVNIEVFSESIPGLYIPGQKFSVIREIQASLLFNTSAATQQYDGSTSLTINYGDTTVGVYIGGGLDTGGVALYQLENFIPFVQDRDNNTTTGLQLCGDNRTAQYTMGIVIDTTPDAALRLFRVQHALRSWSLSHCVERLGRRESFIPSTFWLREPFGSTLLNGTSYASNWTSPASPGSLNRAMAKTLSQVAECRTIQVVSGDSCASLAQKCGLRNANDITKFNPQKDFCATLRPGQSICCSAGTLPDIRPKPTPGGACASYVVKNGDFCSQIAAANGLTVEELEKFNENTWGWNGCNNLYVGTNLCLSKGNPPLPAPVPNAICGPQKPGTTNPKPGTDLASLNPCPLNACCTVWGQCGTTAEFCTVKGVPFGTPLKPWRVGCISNCGTKIVNNESPPSEFKRIGYFEAWNMADKKERPCLFMDATQIPTGYTHIHFAFGDVSSNFAVGVGKLKDQFDKFVKMRGFKRIIAFGGWTASTHPSSFWIFREGVKPGNREVLASNIAKFVVDNDLDGVDLDWEYPGAPDIPDIPSADPLDGLAYLELLKLLRQKLPREKQLAIAAPASYWYLKQFPIGEISKIVDYIVYMTYDLHGQWDFNNPWSSPGCPAGNCLRSHINMTETVNALSMVTKGGVPSTKLVIGVTSYGRSFRMVDPSCTGPMCTFTGSKSGAKPGRCTRTAGYLANAEIQEVLRHDKSARTYYDESTMSDVLVYGSDWVAYMNDDNKRRREALWKSMNFGGISDWAIDLAQFLHNDVSQVPSLPMEEIKEDWANITCKHPYARNSTYKESDRWNTLKADQAWKYVVDRWNASRDNANIDFSLFVSQLLNGPENMYCHRVSVLNGCVGTIECNDDLERRPAATLILRSFMNLASIYFNMYEGVLAAQTSLLTTLPTFSSTFAPDQKADKNLVMTLDILSAGFGVLAGPVFGKAFSAGRFFINNPGIGEKLESTIMGAVDFGLSEAKKHVESGVLKRHAKWGNKGLDKLPDLTGSEEHRNNLIEEVNNGDVKLLPGIMNIPMCDPQTVFDNWVKRTAGQKTDWPSFPCNKED
ncbi:hypothetical protein B0T21DRAFT_382597 [Apiosordaria backusii]|uniref:chitinase n=1 Tax=Apiosordaria backusii TaxID=314023 RepID=A0AA40BSH2_9PEZI|nr:hypothetical protein B0T21DRAFT_382597 [Apiosordaria backusii]